MLLSCSSSLTCCLALDVNLNLSTIWFLHALYLTCILSKGRNLAMLCGFLELYGLSYYACIQLIFVCMCHVLVQLMLVVSLDICILLFLGRNCYWTLPYATWLCLNIHTCALKLLDNSLFARCLSLSLPCMYPQTLVLSGLTHVNYLRWLD